jgi:integrase
MATIRKIKWKTAGGKVSERYQLAYTDRKKQRHRENFTTKAAAEKERIKVEAEILGGTHVPENESRTVQDGITHWLDHIDKRLAKGIIERTTVRHYKTHMQVHVEPKDISSRILSKLTRMDIQEFVEQLESKLSHDMANRIYGTTKMMLSFCRVKGMLAHDPCEGVKVERPSSRYDGEPDLKIPPKASIKKLLETAQKRDITGRSTVMVRLMIFRGLRISEIRGMPKKGLEIGRNDPQLRVMQRADEFCKIGPPKSRTSYRSLALSPEDVMAIKKWYLSAGINDKTKDDALVFGSSSGRPLNYQNLYYRWWIPLLIEAGLTDPVIDPKTGKQAIDPKTRKPKVDVHFTPHQLRHAFASLHIERGIQPKQLQVMMGHSTIQMTMDTYGHLWKDVEAEQALAVGVEQQLG